MELSVQYIVSKNLNLYSGEFLIKYVWWLFTEDLNAIFHFIPAVFNLNNIDCIDILRISVSYILHSKIS